MQDDVLTWDDIEARLAQSLPGYQARPQQQMLARSIETVLGLDGTGALLAQAGCGTGKSLGAMVPAILHAVQNGQRVVVATATKALQEQYANSDVPFLQEKSGIDFDWALLKGRSNYICRAKMAGEEASRIEVLAALKAEIAENPDHTGDREHFATAIEDADWMQLATTSDECPGRDDCPFGEVCFAEYAKTKARKADLVITNTAMAMIDAQVRVKTMDLENGPVEMLGPYEAIVFDEGHEVREYAASSLGSEFSPRSIGFFMRDAMKFLAFQEVPQNDLGEKAAEVMERLDAIFLAKDPRGVLVQPPALSLAWFAENYVPFMDLHDVVENARHLVKEASVIHDVDAQKARRKMLMKRATNILDTIVGMISSEDHIQVRWAEQYKLRNGDDAWRVRTSPVDIGPFMKQAFWDEKTAVIMSATLSSGKTREGENDFTYMKRELGLMDSNVATVDVGTPFDFPNQALMFVPDRTVPNPKGDYNGWMSYSMVTTIQLVEAAQGGALLLYTSRKAMESSFEALAPVLRNAGYTVLMQGNRAPGEQYSNKQLAQMFKEDTHSILFALRTFFTGVDFQGDACRLVIIDKLPFPVPSDPIFAARCLREEKAGRRSFQSLSVPMMTLVLEQAVGRLIRKVTDTGVVAILDSRLSSTPYGRGIVAALPNFPVVTEVSAVRDFYAKHRG